MGGFLRQSTASQGATLGPFIDSTDFATPMTALSIANTDIKLYKGNAANVNKNSGGGTHRTEGEYSITFDATDTDTVGRLKVDCKMSGALSVFDTFTVVEEVVYDQLFAASATGYQVPIWATAGSTVDLSATTIANVDTTEAIGAAGLAAINAEVVDTLNVDTYPEPTVVPPATTTLVKKIGWQQAIARNKLTQTATTQTLRNDTDNADIATSTVSDDSTTAIRGEFT